MAAILVFAAVSLQGCFRGTTYPSWFTLSGWDKYPGYEGDLIPIGIVQVTATEDENVVLFFAAFSGMDRACIGDQSGEGNRCGIHIHSGTNCTEGIGGHYYTPLTDPDPWIPVTYTDASTGGTGIPSRAVRTGYSLADLYGHAVIVHDSTGARVGCAILDQPCDGVRNCPSQAHAASARSGTDPEAGVSPLVLVGAMCVMAVLGGGTWYCRSLRRDYAAQQDEAVEVQSEAPRQDEAMAGQSAA